MGIFDEYDASLPKSFHDKGLNGTLIYDSSGLKPKAKENNPKTLEAVFNLTNIFQKRMHM
jgi:hypothetical protein